MRSKIRPIRQLACLLTAAAASALLGASVAQAQFPPRGPIPEPAPPNPVLAAAGAKDYASSWDEYQALVKAGNGGTKLTPATAPDWSGVWERDMPRGPFTLDIKAKPIPGTIYSETTALLTPRYKAAYDKKMSEISEDREWDRLSWCLPAGFPRMLWEPFLREFIVTPNQTWMTHEQVDETRRIYTDGRAHMTDDDPLWLGDSIGVWVGDTLVIHTDHLKAGQYQRGNPDFSFHTSTVEQFRMVGPGQLQDRITIYDPDSLTKPWRLVIGYHKVPGDVRIRYDSCEENNNTYRDKDGSTKERKPNDPLYKDWRTFGIPEVAWDSIPK